jgi:hypothetical protein
MENYAIIPSLRGIGFKNRNLREFSTGREVVKIIFALGCQGCRISTDKENLK